MVDVTSCLGIWALKTDTVNQFSRSVMSNSLWPHGLQHARLPCPSPTSGAYSNSCPLSQWECSISIYRYSSIVCESEVKVKLLSRVQLFVTPSTAAHQASLSITNSWSLLKLMSIESVVPSNHLILCHPLFLPHFNLSQHQGLFQLVNSSHQVAKVLELQLQHKSFQWIFRTDFL